MTKKQATKKKKVNYLNNKDLLAEVIKSKEQNKMTDKLAHMLQMLTARYGKKGNFAGYCVDDKTEALTQQGWKSYDQLSLNDIILSYDHVDQTLKWSSIKDIFINTNYDGPMHKLDTQGLDAFVTPNHKFVSNERGIIPVEDIICNEHIVLTGNPVEAPTTPTYTDSFVKDVGQNHILSTEFILSLTQKQRLLLIKNMVDVDGWYRPNEGISYIQKNKNYTDAFLMLCTIAGLTTSTTSYEYKNKNPNGSISNIYSTPKLICKAEQIDFHGGRTTSGDRREQKSNTPTQHYKGTIWCPQTEYGTFMCRRGKYIYITGNTYNDDMQAYAMLALVKTWNNFNPDKGSNPFAFFTQCIKHSFIQYLKMEKKQRTLRDEILVDNGLTPSFNYQMEIEERQFAYDEEDHEQMINEANKSQIEQLKTDDLVSY